MNRCRRIEADLLDSHKRREVAKFLKLDPTQVTRTYMRRYRNLASTLDER